ncbi:MAG: hypothetical protein DDT36_01537 [Firmicutes bacterium]|nr:hypothetical protein [Bacillota bacterium]
MRISRDAVVYAMDKSNSPVMRVPAGTVVTFETVDAFGGQVRETDQPLAALDWSRVNPATRVSTAEVKLVPLRDGFAHFSEHFHVPLKPIIEVIGVDVVKGVSIANPRHADGALLDAEAFFS